MSGPIAGHCGLVAVWILQRSQSHLGILWRTSSLWETPQKGRSDFSFWKASLHSVIVFFLLLWRIPWLKSHYGEKGFISLKSSPCHPLLHKIKAGTQVAGHITSTIESREKQISNAACFQLAFLTLSSPPHEVVLPIVGWVLLHQLSRQFSTDTLTEQPDLDNSQIKTLVPGDSRLCQADS